MAAQVTTPVRAASAAAFSLFLAAFAAAQVELNYAPRGDRSEGVRTTLVSGYDLELLSARIGPADAFAPVAPAAWGDQARLRFFVPGPGDVFITVRQLRPRSTNYWLDNVKRRFEPGVPNEYTWPTQEVLRRLRDVGPVDLGVTVRLGRGTPSRSERVVPSMLDDTAGAGDRAYWFWLKTNGRATVSAVISRDGAEHFRQPPATRLAGEPFLVRWAPGSRAEGWYTLTVSGSVAGQGEPLFKEVEFYHRPNLLQR